MWSKRKSPHRDVLLIHDVYRLFEFFENENLSESLGTCWALFVTARKRSLQRLCFYTFLSVILFTGGNTCWIGTPPRAGTPRQVHPQAGTLHSRYILQQVHPWLGTPPRQVPPGRYPWAGTPPGQVHPPPTADTTTYGQWADGMHPTGMHSCLKNKPIRLETLSMHSTLDHCKICPKKYLISAVKFITETVQKFI